MAEKRAQGSGFTTTAIHEINEALSGGGLGFRHLTALFVASHERGNHFVDPSDALLQGSFQLVDGQLLSG
jgi:hypothetical protein